MPGSLFLWVLVLSAGPHRLGQSIFINRCSSPAEKVCDFVCDCRDCSDENQCGYHKESATLGTPFTCDFEDGNCGWQDVSTSAYRWGRNHASISTGRTGPHSDHTRSTNLGWYMAAEMSRGKLAVTARLRSPVMRQAASTCEIHAWYHLWRAGFNGTALPALQMELTHANETVTLWQSPESSVYAWRKLVAYPGRVPGEFQITFSSTQSFLQLRDLAIDDIEFRNCGLPQLMSQVCGPEEQKCQRGSCVGKDRFCDGSDDCGDGSDESVLECKSFRVCSFEADLCGWKTVPGLLTWNRDTGLDVVTLHGQPTRDHSKNSKAGYFLHVSYNQTDLMKNLARLTSPVFQATGNSFCSLTFYSYLYGSATNSINIYYVANATQTLVRGRTGDLGDYWFREKVDFNVDKDFEIVIEGVIGTGKKGHIALDDLILSPDCKQAAGKQAIVVPETNSSCSPPENFVCDDGECISQELACDFAVACKNSSDEKFCGDTDFEAGSGGWRDASVGQLQWVTMRASEALSPGTDHTTSTSAGSYLAVQRAPGQMVTAAKARTPPLGPSGLACSLEMFYWLQSDPQGFIAVGTVDHALRMHRLVWYMQGNGSMEWKKVTVPLGKRPRPFQVELIGLVSPQGLAVPSVASVAVDDVKFVNCDPHVVPQEAIELSCNFEKGLCGWYQDQNDDFEWVRGTGQGLGSDHTTGHGFFMAMDPSAQEARGLSARLLTYLLDPAAEIQCFLFWYRMDGPQIGTLNLKIKHDGEAETVLWTRTGTQGSAWHLGSVTLHHHPQQKYQLIFEALRDGYLGHVALDDLSVKPGTCRAQEHCSFEASACGFTASGEHSWARQSNATGTAVTGPSTDHTTGTARGYYMIINTSKSSLPRAATLASELYVPLTRTQCLTFWYHLSTDSGSLNIHMEEQGARRRLFSVSSMQGDAWHYGSVAVQADGEWKVIFEAVGAGREQSYIALDDLHLKDGSCPEPGSCDFELDTCGWSSSSDPHLRGFAWGWKSGVSPSKYPGPQEDHTLGTKEGHYAYFDASVLGPGGSRALLVSEHLPATTGACLQFWYHMDFLVHFYSGELRVKLYSPAGQLMVWSTGGHQGQGWMNRTIPLQSPEEFQIVFEVTNGAWPIGGTIALDDVKYRDGQGCNLDRMLPVGDKTPTKGFLAAVAVGSILALIVLMALAMSLRYWLKKSASLSRTENSITSPGFDNITFSDDSIIISQRHKEGEEMND
ncbi:apical endosomal glycoprotein [Alligator mississippiensis]|uniref:Apical endosomal glycoprotein n=1 Tax=Alligator mississippiensis TaxID=8496 RepID=A0A151MF08_ALLMI|nr:apical endosomal glycoprotein [Alligator mississippiensis]KYO23091.1 apical endosomal glycoprotein [Alligator mississippiensis]